MLKHVFHGGCARSFPQSVFLGFSKSAARLLPSSQSQKSKVISRRGVAHAQGSESKGFTAMQETSPERQTEKPQEKAKRRSVNDLPLELAKSLVFEHVTSKHEMKVGKKMVTANTAEEIQRRWNTEECVKLHAAHKSVKGNMKGFAMQLEDLTGGLVIWMSGAKVLVYRDADSNEIRKKWKAREAEQRQRQSQEAKHLMQ